MAKLKSIKFAQSAKNLKNLPRFLAERSFLAFLISFIIISFLGSLVFYYFYIFPAEFQGETPEKEELLKLDMVSQQKVLEEWQWRNDNFQAVDSKTYSNPFK